MSTVLPRSFPVDAWLAPAHLDMIHDFGILFSMYNQLLCNISRFALNFSITSRYVPYLLPFLDYAAESDIYRLSGLSYIELRY